MTAPPFPLFAAWAQQASAEAYWATPVLHLLLGSGEQLAGSLQKQHEQGHRLVFYNLPPCVNPLFHQEGTRFGCVPRYMYPDHQVPPVGFYSEIALRNVDGSLRDSDGVYTESHVCMGAEGLPRQASPEEVEAHTYSFCYDQEAGRLYVRFQSENPEEGHTPYILRDMPGRPSRYTASSAAEQDYSGSHQLPFG